MTAEMTIVLLNYRRPGNIPIILDSIRRQTIKPVVFLWNNGPDDVNLAGVDRYENSAENIGCMVRWKMARDADTPYVMSLDDDLCFARDDALADIVGLLRAMDSPDRIVGPAGCCLGENFSYTERREVYANRTPARTIEPAISTSGYEEVDIVKGRSMALRRDRLDGLGLPEEREDDIFLSAALAGGRRRFHRIPARLKNAFLELPMLGVGNWRMPEHSHSRDRAAAAYFRPAPGPWRPLRLGTIHQRDAEQLRIRLGGTSLQLNSSAALIWERCDGTRTVVEILAELSELFGAPEGVLQHDLREALDRLIDAGALESEPPAN